MDFLGVLSQTNTLNLMVISREDYGRKWVYKYILV
jgi:hypothetical protein